MPWLLAVLVVLDFHFERNSTPYGWWAGLCSLIANGNYGAVS
jgi:hypothetical protein